MASSRLERIGTIYSRVEGLLRSGAMKPDDRPIWWDIYRAFPPTREPLYDRPLPHMELKPIFYEEDVIRAKYHKSGEAIGTANLSSSTRISNAQKLINLHKKMKSEENLSGDALYEKCLDIIKKEIGPSNQTREKRETIVSAFSNAKNEMKTNSNIKNIFDE